MYLIKVNSSGDTLWTKRYGDFLDEECYSVQLMSDGGYVMTGYQESVTDNGDVAALRNWYGRRPVKYNPEQYLAARIEAARRCIDEDLTVRLWSLTEHELVMDKFLDRVRQRPAKSPSLAVNEGWVWTWWRPTTRPVPYRGWAAWQYVWDARVALGKIDADTAAWGGRGLESAGAPTWFFPSWDTVGDWSTKAVEAEDWLDIPLETSFTHVQGVRLEPAEMNLKLTDVREIRAIFTPADATCKTGTWTVSSNACWVQPHMLKEIEETVPLSVSRREDIQALRAMARDRFVPVS